MMDDSQMWNDVRYVLALPGGVGLLPAMYARWGEARFSAAMRLLR